MKYGLIEDHSEYSPAKWAAFLKVSRSGYHEWKRKKEERETEEKRYKEQIRCIFNEGNGTYGVDRICGILRNKGETASYTRVKLLMEEMGLKSIHRRRRQRSLTNSKKSRGDGYVNLIKGTEISDPLQVIKSDISYIRTEKGFEYICKIKDIVSGVVLSHTVTDNMEAEMVSKTIRKAIKRWRIKEWVIFHSDRGTQYTSGVVMDILREHGIRQSFTRVGKPGDNAWSESFFANMKKETIHWNRFECREKVREVIFEYIEGFYNTRRVQKRLGYLSPMEWLKNWNKGTLKSIA